MYEHSSQHLPFIIRSLDDKLMPLSQNWSVYKVEQTNGAIIMYWKWNRLPCSTPTQEYQPIKATLLKNVYTMVMYVTVGKGISRWENQV